MKPKKPDKETLQRMEGVFNIYLSSINSQYPDSTRYRFEEKTEHQPYYFSKAVARSKCKCCGVTEGYNFLLYGPHKISHVPIGSLDYFWQSNRVVINVYSNVSKVTRKIRDQLEDKLQKEIQVAVDSGLHLNWVD